jgi:hypothetical protein
MRRIAVLASLVAACGGSGPASPDAAADDGSTTSDGGAVDSTTDTASDAPSPIDAGSSGPRYGDVMQKSAHNAYDKDEPLFDQIVFHRVHSVELDIHVGKNLQPSLTNDWYVYHADVLGLDRTTCRRFSDCLRVLRSVHDAFPQHEIVTVWVDVKDDFRAGQTADDLDARISSELGAANVLRPADLLAACPSAKDLREAVTGACEWPSLSSLRGKFVFALTGGNACAQGTLLDGYAGGGALASKRLGFIAPSIDDTCPFSSYQGVGHALFMNMDSAHMGSASAVRSARLVGRIYDGGLGGGLDDATKFGAGKTAGGHHLATDMVNYLYSPFTVLHGAKGWPFTCVGPCVAPADEPGMRLLGADVRSGDIEGNADSFVFAYDTVQPSGATWTTSMAVASSHVQEWAKGCVMARAGTAADDPYVAVCRPADVHPIRAQARLTKGGGTIKLDATAPANLTAESTFFARMVLTVQGPGTKAVVDASADGVTWQTVTTQTFSSWLPLQGIAVSGHGSPDPVRFVFGSLDRTGTAMDASKLPTVVCVGGGCATQAVYDGPMP